MEALEPYRAAPSEGELARRRMAGLSPRQDALLTRWGYPYVFDEFRFHMTLTGPVADDRAAAVEAALQTHFEPVLGRSLTVDRLCLFVQEAPGAPFVMRQAFPIRRPIGAGFIRMEMH